MQSKYPVVEVFHSFQGEGSQMGESCTFIRLYGCNLKCPFCDEPKHVQDDLVTSLTEEAILGMVKHKNVVITGGEPSMANINPLIVFLQSKGHYVAVETNGFNYYNIGEANHIVLAPKNYSRPDGSWDEVKLLVKHDNINLIEDEIMYWSHHGVKVWLQPINHQGEVNKENMEEAMKLALKHDVGISPQLHKLLEVE